MGETAKKGTEFSTIANDVMRFAEQIKNAGDFIPQCFQGNAGAIAACILTGRELGFEPMASLRNLYVVRGKVGIFYDAIVGLLRKHDYGVEWIETTNEIATIRLTHKNKSLKPFVMSYTKEDAIAAQLWGSGNWKKIPATMLRARCVSNSARSFAGEIMAGIYTVDEIEEIKEREEKPINTLKATGGVSALESALESALDGELGIRAQDNFRTRAKAEEKTEKPNLKEQVVDLSCVVRSAIEDIFSTDVTEYDTILDEIEAAHDNASITDCLAKISDSKTLNEEEKMNLMALIKDREL